MLLALALALTIVLSACGDSQSSPSVSNTGSNDSVLAKKTESKADESEVSKDDETDADADAGSSASYDDDTVFDFSNGYGNPAEIGEPETALTASDVYNKCTYIPEMFLSNYKLLDNGTSYDDYQSEVPMMKFNEAVSSGGGIERQISSIPFEVEGKTLTNETSGGSGVLYIMDAKFYTAKGDKDYRKFLYTVDSKKRTLTLNEIKSVKYNSDYNGITSYAEGQLKLSYTFAFKGLTLTLTKDDASVIMYTGFMNEKDTLPYIVVNGYQNDGSDRIDSIINFNLYKSSSSDFCSIYIAYINDNKEEETSNYCSATMSADGLFTFAIPYENATKTYQYVYFYLQNKGIILTDGSTNYLYFATEKEYHG